MKNFLPLVLGSIACLLLTSCVTTSENPLSSPETAQPDPKLVGTWHNNGDADESFVLTVKDAHWMHIENRKKDKPTESYDMFVTVIDGHRFLNVRQLGNDEQGHPFKKEFFLIRYQVTDHVLSTWFMDQDKADEAVRSGKLKGTIHPGKNPTMAGPDEDVVLQDSGANIVKFIQHGGPKALFSDDASEMIRANR
jgi:hypothetical protein